MLAGAQGWDKTYCLQFVEAEYPEIHFFGDKTFEVPAQPQMPVAEGRSSPVGCTCMHVTRLLSAALGCHLLHRLLCYCWDEHADPVHARRLESWLEHAMQGGNDFEIFSSPKTIGHAVTSPIDTIKQCTELFITPAGI